MKKYLTLLILILIISCTNKQPQRIVYPENQNEELTEKPIIIEETKDKLIAHLPQKLDSTNYIVFPINRLSINNSKTRISKVSYSSSRYNIPLENLIFENILTGKTHQLTKEKIKILSYQQLFGKKRTSEKIIIYKVISNDSNQDGYLDNNDIASLYISDSDGFNFKQLSKPNEQLLEWNYLYETKKVYFRTVEDTDKNGMFDNNDKHSLYSRSIINNETKHLFTSKL